MKVKINKKTNSIVNNKEQLELIKTAFGLILVVFSILVSFSFISFYINWESDQSEVDILFFSSQTKTNNLFGNLGALLGEFFIHRGIGISAFLIPFTFFLFGVKLLLNKTIIKMWKYISHSLFILVWLPIFFAYFKNDNFMFGGVYGFESIQFLELLIGNTGIILLLILTFLIYIIFEFKISAKILIRKIYQIKTQLIKKNLDTTNLKGKYTQNYENKREKNFLKFEDKMNQEKKKIINFKN